MCENCLVFFWGRDVCTRPIHCHPTNVIFKTPLIYCKIRRCKNVTTTGPMKVLKLFMLPSLLLTKINSHNVIQNLAHCILVITLFVFLSKSFFSRMVMRTKTVWVFWGLCACVRLIATQKTSYLMHLLFTVRSVTVKMLQRQGR